MADIDLCCIPPPVVYTRSLDSLHEPSHCPTRAYVGCMTNGSYTDHADSPLLTCQPNLLPLSFVKWFLTRQNRLSAVNKEGFELLGVSFKDCRIA